MGRDRGEKTQKPLVPVGEKKATTGCSAIGDQ
jgi:hypothetical protein